MMYLIGGYIWLYLHRPFEYWPSLGEMRLERVYMCMTIFFWLLHPNKTWISNRLNKALGFFTVSILACWFASPRIFPSDLGEKVFEEHWKVGVLFLIIITTVNSEQKLKQLLMFYFLAVFLFQFHSFVEFVNGRHEFRQGIVRMKAVNKTHDDPNTFSATLLHALPYLLPFWFTARQPRVRSMVAAHIGLTLLCIYLTGSRRAYVGIAFLSFVLAIKSKHRWSLLGLGLLLIPLAFVVMRDDLQERLLTIFNPSSGNIHAVSSARFRWSALTYGWDIWMDNPITGTGPSTFALASKTGLQAHNLYSQTMSEMGLLGILSLLAMVICFFRNSREVKRLYAERPWWEKDFTYHVATTGTGLAIVLLLFMGVGGHNLFRYNWIWFGAFQMCAVKIAQRRAETELSYGWEAEPAPFGGYAYQPA